MSMKAPFMRIARGFDRLSKALKPAPRRPAPVRHSFEPRFSTLREVIYQTWDMHEQAQVVVTLVLDESQGLHILMANAPGDQPTAPLRMRVANLLSSAMGIVMAAEGKERHE